MSGEKESLNIVQIICVAIGIVIGLVLVNVFLDFGSIINGALGGGFGAVLGLGIYGLIGKGKK